MIKHLLRLSDLTIKQINDIIDLAIAYKNKKKTLPDLSKYLVANIFLESSTRTHYSFLAAQQNLKCKILDFASLTSSMNKGETFYDTCKTFVAMGANAIVCRSSQNQWYKEVLPLDVHLINAGDGTLDHPTQTLLDLMTIKEHFHKFNGLNVAIVGDIVHSRVAHSNIDVMKRLGMNVYICAPKELQDKKYKYVEFDKIIHKLDVINLLRIQNERLEQTLQISLSDYNKQYGLSTPRLNKTKTKCIIIHPAPFNRNVEINDDCVEHKKSKIFTQITNGVFIRMAVLNLILNK
ncbi:MAG: aspartate carbamoyltransferase catalytic subunit [Mycoplasmataceae bacterium]|nr:aspartate carbamoyltransferase catalytic subunit [Mycoplasmataceae bacterium]